MPVNPAEAIIRLIRLGCDVTLVPATGRQIRDCVSVRITRDTTSRLFWCQLDELDSELSRAADEIARDISTEIRHG